MAPDDSSVVEMVAGEMLSNAVIHGSGDQVVLRLTLRGTVVRTEVCERAVLGPGRRPPARDSDESGRGELLIAALSKEWGTFPRNPAAGQSRCVWAECEARLQ